MKHAVVAVGSSAGGPAALHEILSRLDRDFALPIVITQHISPGFVDGMVRWLDDASALKVKVAEHGEPLRDGVVYVAADNHHLTIAKDRTIALSDEPLVAGHRPSATVLFKSAAKAYGAGVLAIILTGMGKDGVDGLAAIQSAGGTVIAQDEKSSAVFGMPKAAIDAGYTDEIISLDGIIARIWAAGHPNGVHKG
jgi:two-component system, chemotaxis family, protein-glutamate methylesterase/glutaminase